jgi:tRNA(fMet)-specific endonuclease VapC
MRETLIDTDILSEIMEGKDAALAARAKQYYRVFRQYTISAATYAEIRAGLAYNPKPKDVRSFELIEPLLDVLPIEREEAATAGQIIGLLKSRGLPLGALDDLDPFIAATAIEQQMVLATGNFAHYQRIVDLGFPLELENWREP